jgi:hypothetical protein
MGSRHLWHNPLASLENLKNQKARDVSRAFASSGSSNQAARRAAGLAA